MTEPMRPPPDWVVEGLKPQPWEATITPARRGYWITFSSGLMEHRRDTGWWRLTRKGAERCARKVIANLTADDARRAASWTVQ